MEKLQPKLRFPEFEGNWIESDLKKVSSKPKYGLNTSAKEYDGINGYIRITDIDEDSRTFLKDSITSPSEYSDDYLVKENDILFTRTGASTGKSYLYNQNDGKLYFAGFLINFSIKNANSKFVFYTTLNDNYYKWVKVMSMRSGQPGINAEEYGGYNFKIPKLEEQQKIAQFLTQVDTKINQLTKKQSLLEQYKKGIMQKIFNQEIRFKDDNGNDYPDWEINKLGAIIHLTMGQSPNSSSYNLTGEGLPLIQGNADINNRKTYPRQWTDEPTKICDIGDLILTVRAPVGYVAKSYHYACIGRGVCSIKPINNNALEFIYQFMLYFENKWGKLEQGSTFTAVSGQEIKSIDLEVPCIEEQTKIANFLSAIDDKINQVNTQLEKTKEFKKGLLQQMFV